ncbi:MAG TPA: SCP2 sterol-binding domain-containing protein [Acidimicrobiales bacterium]|nr:SCP2 sterol-binding domain-containing protein [Acidimicrobiales bacterium]
MAEDFAVSDRESLAKLLEGLSDDDINAAVGPTVDQVLDQVFDGMRQAFVPERAAGQAAVVQWDISAPDGTKTYQFKVADGACEVVKGAAESARVTLGLSLPDFLRFVAGQLDGMQAFMGGKLRLSGDMMFAQSMQSWFAA